ncbi:hypothetical protein KV699_08735 [Vreelandella titanicae]|uniref:hypothetical protein n=1 Tax=Vreelandella titanicae TaxID=664683 RepID=UPI003BB00A13
MEENKVFKSRLVGEGVIVALITAFTYIVAYLYEYGYVSYFGIPKSFISINIVTLLVAAGSIGFIVFTSAQFLGFTLPMFRTSNDVEEKNIHYRRFMFLNACALVVGIFLFRAYGPSLIGVGIYLVVVIFSNIMIFGFKILKPVKMPLKERVSTSALNDDDPFDIWLPIRSFFGINIYRTFMIVILFFWLAYVVGNSEAHRQKEFLVTTVDKRSYILVRKYEDNFIFLSIAKNNENFTNIIKVKSVSSDEYISFNLTTLGRLSKK